MQFPLIFWLSGSIFAPRVSPLGSRGLTEARLSIQKANLTSYFA